VDWRQIEPFWNLIHDTFFPKGGKRDPLGMAVNLALLIGLGLVALLALALSASSPGTEALRLVPGMSHQEAIAVQGEPDGKAAVNEFEQWYYPDGTRLKFRDGRLTEWDLPDQQASGVPGTETDSAYQPGPPSSWPGDP
jgi:hypothetical protein